MDLQKIFCRLGVFGHGPGNISVKSEIGYQPICKKCGRTYGPEDVVARIRYFMNIGLSFFVFIGLLISLGFYQFLQLVGGMVRLIF